MRIVAARADGVLLIEMDDGTARVLDPEKHEWIDAPSAEAVLARGGWQEYAGDADPAKLLDSAHPLPVAW